MDTITEEEIAVLNAARTLLNEQSRMALGGTAREARVAAAAEIAENAIFRFLNWTSAYGHVELSKEQLHNKALEEAVA